MNDKIIKIKGIERGIDNSQKIEIIINVKAVIKDATKISRKDFIGIYLNTDL